MSVNFPEASREPLINLARTFGAALSTQTPIGGMHGGVNSRLVRQFRMPGYPTVLITTDVLQEGEDLHTFCDRIVHYGISWTPSAMEQRTGRIDRIGSLTHRTLGALERSARPGRASAGALPVPGRHGREAASGPRLSPHEPVHSTDAQGRRRGGRRLAN